jgi:hypothetical protein
MGHAKLPHVGVRRLFLMFPAVCAALACSGQASAARLHGPLEFDRSGGIAGLTENIRIQPSGRARVDTKRTRSRSFTLSARERRRVETAVRDAHLARVKSPKQHYVPDAFVYRIVYGGRKIAFDQTSVPHPVEHLLDVLQRLVTSHS